MHGCHYEAGRDRTLQEECSRHAAGCNSLDMSIERLVAGVTGKESKLSIEDFFATQTAIPVVKRFGSLYLNCREKPLCFYARW